MRDWDEFVKLQASRIGHDAANKWLYSLKVVHFDAGNLYLEARDSFQAAWFEEHMRAHAEESLRNRNNRKIKVHLRTQQQAAAAALPTTQDKRPKHGASYQLVFDEIDPYCTFDHFTVNDGNCLAYQVLRRLCLPADDPEVIAAGTYNPVFLYGGAGVGKTHLLMAAAHALRQRGVKALYVRGTTFTEHVVSAIRGGAMQIFRSAYRKADCLLVDDLQVLSNKTATQEELFHTFNTLHVASQQLILAANCAPQELRAVEPRLISRFEWGLTTSVELPGVDELREIAICKATALGIELADEVLTLLIDTWGRKPKELIQALEAIALRGHLQLGRQSQLATKNQTAARDLLQDLIEKSTQTALTPDRVISSVSGFYGVDIQQIKGKSQRRECSLPRQVAMYFCRELLHLPFPQIGDIFRRDHSTVITSVNKIQQRLTAGDTELTAMLKSIRKTF